jgi:nucleoside-diphosphate-sugar epimerase
MRLLVLGGTLFLGRVLVEESLRNGHDVTTFNRGRSGADLPGTDVVRGDREQESDLRRLSQGRSWDAVVDTSGFVPRIVRDSARILADRVDRYVFVSSVSVYRGWPVEPLNENSAVLECPSDAGPEFGYDDPRGYPTQYGFQKSGCERAVQSVFNDRGFVLRPGVILGVHEYVGRLPWWLRRVARGGRTLAPGYPDRKIQPIDVRDVATFILTGLVSGASGVFNVVAPRDHTTFGSFLNDCIATTGSDAQLVWVDDQFLLDRGVRQWTELPLWRTFPGTWNVASDRALAAGLNCRPMADTVRDTWIWLRGTALDPSPDTAVQSAEAIDKHGQTSIEVEKQRQAEHGIAFDKEQRLLEEWDHSR